MAEALAIRHVAFEDLGCFEEVLGEAGLEVRYCDIGVGPLERVDALAPRLLVVLGGPIGVYEEAAYPFLTAEIALIERRLAARLPTLGICLGAQLMARALGARVYPGSGKEIGLAPIALTAAGRASCLAAIGEGPVLHWHGDTFDLPAGAERLAATPLYANQAFRVGDHAIAFQFHPEAGGPGFERWLIGHAAELAAAGIDVAGLRADYAAAAAALRARGQACFRAWLAAAGLAAAPLERTAPQR